MSKIIVISIFLQPLKKINIIIMICNKFLHLLYIHHFTFHINFLYTYKKICFYNLIKVIIEIVKILHRYYR